MVEYRQLKVGLAKFRLWATHAKMAYSDPAYTPMIVGRICSCGEKMRGDHPRVYLYDVPPAELEALGASRPGLTSAARVVIKAGCHHCVGREYAYLEVQGFTYVTKPTPEEARGLVGRTFREEIHVGHRKFGCPSCGSVIGTRFDTRPMPSVYACQSCDWAGYESQTVTRNHGCLTSPASPTSTTSVS